jgi:DNA end-binding protein Ku
VFEAERPKSNVIDLMAALEASVEKMGPTATGGTGETGTGQARPDGGGRPAARGPAAASGPPDLDALSKADLLARAAELDIPGRSKMPKPELIKAIQAAGRPKRRARKIS